MPTIDLDIVEFEKLLGVQFHGDMEKLDDLLAYVKSEVKLYDKTQGIASIEIKDTNRPDLWSAEGLARGLRTYLKFEKGPRQYTVGETIIEVNVDSRLKTIRPFIACSIIKNIKLSDPIIRGLMNLQDKLDRTYGRSRQKTSIGIYDFDLMAMPLSYTVAKPNDLGFIPLGFTERMSLSEILERHPKGQEYGHIVKGHSVYPILLDAEQKVLSFPPIINSNDLGRVTEQTHNLLVEVTGTTQQTVQNSSTLVTTALIDRGGKAYSASVQYPKETIYSTKNVVTPNFSNKQVKLSIEYTNKIIGLKLTGKQIAKLLLIAGLGVSEVNDKFVNVEVPCYRIDIMHPVDIVEDVAVAFGYNNIEPTWRDLATTGDARPKQHLVNIARDLMIGAGYQEVSSYTLTNPESLFTKMNQTLTPTVEISNPKLITMTCLRNALLPGLMEFLSVNQSVEFPQKIFELGKVSLLDGSRETKTRDEEWIAATTCHANANFSEIKSCLDSFLRNLGLNWQIKSKSHPSFIEGRVGSVIVNDVEVGLLGEVNPVVLEAWKLENPVAALEINFERILESMKR